MQERPAPMTGNFVLFLVCSFAILFGWMAIQPRPEKKPVGGDAKVAAKADVDEQEPEQPPLPADQADAEPAEPAAAPQQPQEDAPKPVIPRKWITLGSLDPTQRYRMLVTFDNRGASVARIELNSPRYRDLEDRSGYLGHLVLDESAVGDDARGQGAMVQVVGPGTPAAAAGLEPGELIVAMGREKINSAKALRKALKKTKPKRKVQLTVIGENKKQRQLSVTLARRPLEVIRPENDDPLSFLFTLDSFDDEKLEDQRIRDRCILQLFAELQLREKALTTLDISDVDLRESEIQIPDDGTGGKQWVPLPLATKAALHAWVSLRGEEAGPLFVALPEKSSRLSEETVGAVVSRRSKENQRDAILFEELDGVDLRTGNWEVVPGDESEAVFRRVIRGLEITKTYYLAKLPKRPTEGQNNEAYHLEFTLNVRNIAEAAHEMAYQLDGPTGLPIEGVWYANKVGRSWSAGLRDLVVHFDQADPAMIGCPKIAEDDYQVWQKQALLYMGVDAQYFSCVLSPQNEDPAQPWFAQSQPLRVGRVDPDVIKVTNTSCRLKSEVHSLAPGQALEHQFEIFVGPKKPDVLAEYGLGELVYYGWFSFLAKPMAAILHFFYFVVPNYGVAILLLTVLVRGCMFPLSRKQALGARKMQELQPEIKKLQEKYKKDMEARTKAQQELFRKHNYNPLSGCLVLFVQLPIFIALYRSLMVDIELRQAPLISESIRWCSNLAAPDMLFNWSRFMPDFINSGVGIFGLGQYFNVLPILTIFLFIAQQKMFMPPPADDQAAMQQKIMKYMMVFMGLLFFKVASGLCIYFIASSMWGLAERQFLPKASPAPTAAPTRSRAEAKAHAKTRPKPKPEQAASNRDGAAASKKKKKSRGKK